MPRLRSPSGRARPVLGSRSAVRSADSLAIAAAVLQALVTAGLPLRFDDLPSPIPEDQARWAFSNAHLMRNRFSSADLLHFLGWFDEAFTDRVFTRMHALAGRARRRT